MAVATQPGHYHKQHLAAAVKPVQEGDGVECDRNGWNEEVTGWEECRLGLGSRWVCGRVVVRAVLR